MEEAVAVVRVGCLKKVGGSRIDFTDYLLMLKMDGKWKCVAKAYNQKSNTVRQTEGGMSVHKKEALSVCRRCHFCSGQLFMKRNGL